jgi:hypothetical protein
LVADAVRPVESLTVRRTTHVPAWANVCDVRCPVPDPPSPKSHVQEVAAALESEASNTTVFVPREIVGSVGENVKSATSWLEAVETVTVLAMDAVWPRSFLPVSVTV